MNDELIHEITLAWVEGDPETYPLGEYDPAFRKLSRRFKGIIQSDRG